MWLFSGSCLSVPSTSATCSLWSLARLLGAGRLQWESERGNSESGGDQGAAESTVRGAHGSGLFLRDDGSEIRTRPRASGLETVADPGLGEQVTRPCRVGLELLATGCRGVAVCVAFLISQYLWRLDDHRPRGDCRTRRPRDPHRRAGTEPPVRVAVARRTYPTDQADLWDCLTNAERIPRWFLPVSGELVEGGRYQTEGNAGGVIEKVCATGVVRGDVGVRRDGLVADRHAHPGRRRYDARARPRGGGGPRHVEAVRPRCGRARLGPRA